MLENIRHYRYEDYPYWDGAQMEIRIREFITIRKTPRGRWIKEVVPGTDRCIYGTLERLVLDHATRKFAYPAKDLALASFKRRKECQLWHAQRHHDIAQAALNAIERGFEPGEPFTDELLREYQTY